MSHNKQPKFISISKKLILTVIPIMTISILLLMGVNYLCTKEILLQTAGQTLRKETEATVNTIETFVESTLSSLDRVYDTMKTVTFSSEEAKKDYLMTTRMMQPEIPSGVYIGDNTNYWLDPTWVPYDGYQVAEQNWYKEGLEHTHFSFGSPYIDANTGGYVVSATALLSSNGDVKSVIAADVELNHLSEEIATMQIMGNGYCFLAEKESSTILAHKDSSLIGTCYSQTQENAILRTVTDLATTKEYTTQTVKENGVTYMIAIEPIDNTSWILVTCIDQATVIAPLSRLQLLYGAVSILGILITAFAIIKLIRTIVTPIRTLTDNISKITDGDFTVKIDTSGNDEVSFISNGLNDFVEIMHEVITDIRDVTNELNEQVGISKEVATNLKQTAITQSESLGEIAITIDQLAAMLDPEQQDISDLLRTTMETFTDTSLTLSQESHDVAGCADIVAESAFTLSEHMNKFKI